MSKSAYERYERNWNLTKPIRGRSVEVRPIGDRRRDWEQIVRHPIDEGMWSYAARLYNTDVVTYLPNGDIIINTNGWHTPSTAEFIHEHSPFLCFKRNNKLWVQVKNINIVRQQGVPAVMTMYPLPDGPMRFTDLGNFNYRPAEKVVIQKKVINRVLAKEAREPLQPFLAWAKAFLTMSDGWVMHETAKEALGWEQYKDGGGMHFPLLTRDDREMYKLLTEQADIEPEHVYLRVLCCLTRGSSWKERLAYTHTYETLWHGNTHTFTQRFNDYQIEFDAVKRKVYAWVEKFENVHKIVEVEPTNKTMSGVV